MKAVLICKAKMYRYTRYLAKFEILTPSDTPLGKGRQVTTWTKSSVISAAMTTTYPAEASPGVRLGTLLVQTAAGKMQDGMSTHKHYSLGVSFTPSPPMNNHSG